MFSTNISGNAGWETIFVDPKVWACGHRTPVRFTYAIPATDGIGQSHSQGQG